MIISFSFKKHCLKNICYNAIIQRNTCIIHILAGEYEKIMSGKLNSISDIIISNFLFCLINAEIDEVLLNFLIFGITLIDQKIRDVLIKPLFFLKKKVSLVNFIY